VFRFRSAFTGQTLSCIVSLTIALPALAAGATSSAIDPMPAGSAFSTSRNNWDAQIARNPTRADLHLGYAKFLLSAGLIDNAIVEFESASRLDPKNAEPLIELGELSLQNLDLEKAQNYAQKALYVQPGSSSARIVLLTALVQRDRIGDAERELEILRSSEPRNPRVLQLAYMVKIRVGDFTEARKYLQQAVALQPNKIDWVLELCKMMESSGNDSMAYEYLQNLLKRYPNSVDARLRLARNLEVYRHDYDGAITEYGRVLEVDSKSPVATAGIERCKGKKNNLALRMKQSLHSYFSKK
jgi:tetratricopeptide (TPR) repeat protein